LIYVCGGSLARVFRFALGEREGPSVDADQTDRGFDSDPISRDGYVLP
jgi:hypothetical protein